MEAIKDMRSLKQTFRLAFEGAKKNLSVTQQEVTETLRHMRLSVEVRCPKWGYSIDNARERQRPGDWRREEQYGRVVGNGV